MRGTYIVSYDIADPKRLKKVFKLMRNWGDHLQLSVFHCELSPEELLRLEAELTDLINSTEDQAMIAYLGPACGRAESAIHTCGKPLVISSRGATVV